MKENTLAKTEVQFENVSFAYSDEDVLKNISFTANANSLTAIVVPSGGSKSTIAKLLVHYWDVKIGSANREVAIASFW